MKEIYFDSETTGLQAEEGDRVIQLAAVKAKNGKIIDRLSQYINPEGRRISLDSHYVHGIKDDDLKDMPTFEEFYPKLVEFFEDGPVIAHNAPFDEGFLRAECERKGLPMIVGNQGIPIIDSIKRANQIFPGQPNGLDALCRRLKVNVGAKRDKHDALHDCELLFEVCEKMKKYETAPQTQNDLFTQTASVKKATKDRVKIPVFLIQ